MLNLQPELHELAPAIETASQLAARYLLVCGNDPDESRLIAHFAALCEAARPLGLKGDVEVHAVLSDSDPRGRVARRRCRGPAQCGGPG